MIEWYRNLYMDDEVKKSPDSCRHEAESGKIHIMPLYCVSLAANDSNLLDIISCNELYFKYHKLHTMYVVGLASSYKSAVNLAADILIEVYKNTGAFDVRTYYGNQALGCDN